MSLPTKLKENALTVAIIIVALAIALSVYDRFFSDRAKLLKVLQEQIEAKEEEVAQLVLQLQALTQEEEKRMQEIGALKEKLQELQNLIQKGEVKLNDIKDKLIDLDSAISIIEEHTRNSIAGQRTFMLNRPGTTK